MDNKNKAEEKFAEEFAKLMIQKIETLEKDWSQPWLNAKGSGFPQSVNGRMYNGMNSFMLYLLSEMKDYKLPVFLTFKQAKDMDATILKGEKSFPVIYWNFTIKHKETGNKIELQDYNKLSTEEKLKYTVRPFLVYHNVFNVDQTNLREVKPELYRNLEEKFSAKHFTEKEGMFAYQPIDEMIDKQAWLCKINVRETNKAFYTPSKDEITVPKKAQFMTGEAFYATLLHEITHSTGTPDRLNRKGGNQFGDSDYAKEELVAELTAALICQSIGISSSVMEENAAYLKGWLSSIRQSPDYLMDILGDVNKASRMIVGEVAKFDESLAQEVKVQDTTCEHEAEKHEEQKSTMQTRHKRKTLHI